MIERLDRLHTIPFLIPHDGVALVAGVVTIAFELFVPALIRWRFFETGFLRSIASPCGAIIVGVSARWEAPRDDYPQHAKEKGWRKQP
jgi:hypothetical protein